MAESPLSLQSLSEATGLKKTTVHGLLKTLVALGYVTHAEQKYALGLRLRELSRPLEQKDEFIRRQFGGLLIKMAQLSNNTAYLAVQSGSQEYLYIDAIEGGNPLTIRSPRGRREGLISSAIGKVFLAFDKALRSSLRLQQQLTPELETELNQVITQGYALDLEQAEANLNCLAIPLYLSGTMVAVAGISGPADELTKANLQQLANAFLQS